MARLTRSDQVMLRQGARAAAKAESLTRRRFSKVFDLLESEIYRNLTLGLEPPQPDFEATLLEGVYTAMDAAFSTAPRARLGKNKTPVAKTGGKNRLPSNPAELRRWWDAVRTKKAPKRIQVLASKIKKAYIKTVQKLWVRYSPQFRSGETFNEDEVKSAIRKTVDVPRNRANTIVCTENTRYFNTARIRYFDKQETVTHYLFIAIRDQRTTKWCRTRQGLVYEKKSEYFKRERPPTHYNCRSEIVPLTPFNPRHRALIADRSLARANNNPEPLLPNWNNDKV